MKNLPDAPQCSAKGCTRLYRRQDGLRGKNDPNGRRLASVMKMFGLAPSAVAKAGKVSPTYLSRIMNETDPFVGSAGFYRRLEDRLGQVIDQRPGQFFRIAPVNVRSVERAARDVVDLAA